MFLLQALACFRIFDRGTPDCYRGSSEQGFNFPSWCKPHGNVKKSLFSRRFQVLL